MFGATQLMMQSIIVNKLSQCRPDILIRPPVSRFRVLDFMKIESVMSETASVKSEVKRAVEAALKSHYEPRKH
jgi:NTE family protein